VATASPTSDGNPTSGGSNPSVTVGNGNDSNHDNNGHHYGWYKHH
jgi:hypothetical protein